MITEPSGKVSRFWYKHRAHAQQWANVGLDEGWGVEIVEGGT